MAFFYQFQRCRIVNTTWEDVQYPEMVGQECTLMEPQTCTTGTPGSSVPCWLTDLPHPVPGTPYNYCVLESMIEPVQYDFDKEEEENILEELDAELCPELIVVRGDRWDNGQEKYN